MLPWFIIQTRDAFFLLKRDKSHRVLFIVIRGIVYLSPEHTVVLVFAGLIFEGEIFSQREISHVVHV